MINGNDLHEITSSILTGLTVGIGSQILLFDNGSTILVRCKYICIVAGDVTIGDGEVLSTAVNVFPLLNNKVLRTGFGSDCSLFMLFENGNSLKIVPDANGMESYILSTKLGVVPILCF